MPFIPFSHSSRSASPISLGLFSRGASVLGASTSQETVPGDICRDRNPCSRRARGLAYLHHREHAAQFDRAELTGSDHHRQLLSGAGISTSPIAIPPVDLITIASGASLPTAFARSFLERPVVGFVRENIEGAYRADGTLDGGFRPLRALGDPPTAGAAHGKVMSVQMDRVFRHREIADAHAHAIAKRIASGSTPRNTRLFQVLKSIISFTFGR